MTIEQARCAIGTYKAKISLLKNELFRMQEIAKEDTAKIEVADTLIKKLEVENKILVACLPNADMVPGRDDEEPRRFMGETMDFWISLQDTNKKLEEKVMVLEWFAETEGFDAEDRALFWSDWKVRAEEARKDGDR